MIKSPVHTIRVIKFDVGSPTDATLARLQAKLGAATMIEAMRRGLTIADRITDIAKDSKLFVRALDGTMRELLIC